MADNTVGRYKQEVPRWVRTITIQRITFTSKPKKKCPIAVVDGALEVEAREDMVRAAVAEAGNVRGAVQLPMACCWCSASVPLCTATS